MWLTLLLLGVATGAASFTIAKTKISAPFRTWVATKSAWLGNLFSCPYCVSHWLAAIAVLIYQPRVVERWIVTDLGVSWLVTVAISAATFGIIHKAILVSPAPTTTPQASRHGF